MTNHHEAAHTIFKRLTSVYHTRSTSNSASGDTRQAFTAQWQSVLSGKLHATVLEGSCSPQPLHEEGRALQRIPWLRCSQPCCSALSFLKQEAIQPSLWHRHHCTLKQLCPSGDQPELTQYLLASISWLMTVRCVTSHCKPAFGNWCW